MAKVNRSVRDKFDLWPQIRGNVVRRFSKKIPGAILIVFFSKNPFLAKNLPERIIFCDFLLFFSIFPGDVHFSKSRKSAISNISRAILLISRNSVYLKGHFIHKNTNFYTTLSSTYTKHKNMTIFKAHKDHFCFYFMHLTTTKIPRWIENIVGISG